MYRVRVRGDFAAAHYLTRYHGKCENLHGHNYTVWVHAEGSELDEGGMLFDFGDLKKALKKVMNILDHTCLNEIEAFSHGNPSAELIAKFIFDEIQKEVPLCPLSMVEVSETENNIASYLPG